MPTRKSTFFYAVLIAIAGLAAGMVIASRMDLAPVSQARSLDITESRDSSAFSGPLDASTFRTLAADAGPSVVSIITTVREPARPTGIPEFFFDQFNQRPGRRQQPPMREGRGAGSGFIIDRNGYVLTNNHVVENATRIDVKLAAMRDGEPLLPAKLVGRDVLTDTALLQITDLPSEGLPQARLGDSTQMGPGDWVMAIGNPFALSNTVTVGIVSAVGRTSAQLQPVPGRDLEMIQTDAAINRGNSGGPLLNVRGEVIGINTAIFSDDANGGNVGVGFAVPINTVKEILPQLQKGKVVRSRIAVLLQGNPLTREDIEDLDLPRTGGAVVSSVEPGGPADKAGLKAEDVIVEFNGKTVTSNGQLTGMVTRTAPGTTVPLKIVRNKRTLTLNVTTEELDLDAEQNQSAGRRPRETRQEAQESGFGLTLEPISREMLRELRLPTGTTAGAVVVEVNPVGPAAQGGLLVNDVILRVNGTAVRSVDEAVEQLQAVPAGRSARLLVWRVNQNGEGRETLVSVRKQ